MQVNWFSMRDKNRRFFFIFCVVVTLAYIASASWAGSNDSGKLSVYVVNYPLQYFAERIGGEHVKVVFPAPADVDPAFWMPDAETISDYQQADLILLNGAGYARWVNKVSLPRFRMVNTSAGFKDRYIEAAETLTHSHGSEGEHAHESLAFTTWIDFNLAVEQATTIAVVLGSKRPELKNTFQKNYQKLEHDLLKLDQDLKALISKDPSRPLVASHPVYDYFARRYGLNIKSVHWEPDLAPSTEQMLELHRILKEHPAKWLIWEGKPLQESARQLRAIGVDSLVFEPCGNTPEQGDFLSVMRQNVENLRLAFNIE